MPFVSKVCAAWRVRFTALRARKRGGCARFGRCQFVYGLALANAGLGTVHGLPLPLAACSPRHMALRGAIAGNHKSMCARARPPGTEAVRPHCAPSPAMHGGSHDGIGWVRETCQVLVFAARAYGISVADFGISARQQRRRIRFHSRRRRWKRLQHGDRCRRVVRHSLFVLPITFTLSQ